MFAQAKGAGNLLWTEGAFWDCCRDGSVIVGDDGHMMDDGDALRA